MHAPKGPYDFDAFRKRYRLRPGTDGLDDGPVMTEIDRAKEPAHDFLLSLGDRFGKTMPPAPMSRDETFDAADVENSRHKLQTVFDAELSATVEYLGYVQGRIQRAIDIRSGIKSLFYFMELSTLRGMQAEAARFDVELRELEENVAFQLSKNGSNGLTCLTEESIQTSFQNFRDTRLNKLFNRFEKDL